MTKYKFIKSHQQMTEELHTLWNNEELLTFVKGQKYIEKREKEITECLTEDEQELFITLSKFDFLLK